MNRERMLREIQEKPDAWDVIIIGGGATGLGAAVDAVSRGFRTLLLEQCDFAKATSSKSTKLIHGGLRYLEQGNIHLVMEALKERGILCANAPHLVHPLPFLIPAYHWWEKPYYGLGLKIYDLLARDLRLKKCRMLSRTEALHAIPTLLSQHLRGGTVYYDGQFDDARLALCLARSAADRGAVVINYMKVTNLIKQESGLCCGVEAIDEETRQTYQLRGKAIINATGVFSDHILHCDDPKAAGIIAPSQGIHLVLDKTFLPNDHALLIPHTRDKRILFMIPWHERVLLGTTDTPVSNISLEPRPLNTEIDFLLEHASHYLEKAPSRKDIVSLFAGLRPLIKAGNQNTSSLSRDHSIFLSPSQLITIAGGKWTTYRKMAEDVIDKAILVGKLPSISSATQDLQLHGWDDVDPLAPLSTYGTDAKEIRGLIKEKKALGDSLHPSLPYLWAEVIWCIRNEMARTVEDVLARRTRCLLLDARLSISLAPRVAHLLSQELQRDERWEKRQIEEYNQLAEQYCVESYASFNSR